MKGSLFQILLIFGLLAFLQYSWLTQIAVAEKDRLEKRLKLDTERFAEDFNKELQTTYFGFQINDENWRETFTERFVNWKQTSAYPQLIKQVTVIIKNNQTFFFNQETQQFTTSESPLLFDEVKENSAPIDEQNLTLRVPIFGGTPISEEVKGIDQLNKLPAKVEIIRTSLISNINGYFFIKLDENTINYDILQGLGQKYFPDSDYDFSVVRENDKTIVFQTNTVETSDATVSIFSLSPDNLSLILNKGLATALKNPSNKQLVFSQKFETNISSSSNIEEKATVKVINGEKPRFFSGNLINSQGLWNLNVRHKEGSIDNFVGKIRNRNLAVSFGILSLLAVCIGLVFISTNRARRFALRQIEFVSSVSHEFRTPLAVIYSASENLTDGVVDSPENIKKYGNLIKREGKKLSTMVEQILEFAGANSGKQKFNFESVEISQVVENAVVEFNSVIAENKFTVEKNITVNIFIKADANALSHAIQNLIANSIKYNNGKKWLKISTEKINNEVKITVEDKGIGISKHDLKHIFEPFYRGKEVVDAQIHGNGLGLSLVKQIVEAHSGKINVESKIGIGSKFSIQLAIVE